MSYTLVTGGAGFIGSHLARHLLGLGHSVVVLDDLSTGFRSNVSEGATFVEGSITDTSLVDGLFQRFHFEQVWHFAAFAAEAISNAVRRFNYETNVMGSVNLVNAATRFGTQYFGFASSIAVYGHGRLPMQEIDGGEPSDSYGVAKLAIENELLATMRHDGMPFTAFRLHNVYGPGQNMSDPYRNAVTIFLNQILRGEPMSVYGDGLQRRAFTYIDDVIPNIAASAVAEEAWGQSLNIGAKKISTVIDLAKEIRTSMGIPDYPIDHLPARNEVQEAYTDSSLARKILGDWEDTALHVGVSRTAAWAREVGPMDIRPSFELEVDTDRLPAWVSRVEQRAGR